MNAIPDELAVLISDVRHDANNALMAIFGYLELLLLRRDLPADAVAKLRLMEVETRKIRDHMARLPAVRRPRA
jgi:signal transduction histidine kinase